jgi:hypothetical protein
MVGQNSIDPPLFMGAPGMTILVPNEQWLSSYTFGINSNFTGAPETKQSFVMIARQSGTNVTLDSADPSDALTQWQDAAPYQILVKEVSGGTHTVEADSPVGVTIFGLGAEAGYAMPAGMALTEINPPT